MTNLRLFETQFADDNFKFDKNGRKLTRQVENTVEKGEITCYEQFLFFSECFQKTCENKTHENKSLFRKGLISREM